MTERPDAKQASPIRVFGLFGALVAAFSLVSLGERVFEFGLTPVVADFVGYYRQISDWLFGWIALPFGIEIPLWLRDLWALSAVGCGLMVRGIDWEKGLAANPDGFDPAKAGPVSLAFICGAIILSLIGLLGLFILLISFLNFRDPDDRQFRREGILLLLALVGFFLVNAYAPGV